MFFRFTTAVNAYVQAETVDVVSVADVSDSLIKFNLNAEVEMVLTRPGGAGDGGSAAGRRVATLTVLPRERAGVVVSEGGVGAVCDAGKGAMTLARTMPLITIDARKGWEFKLRNIQTQQVLLRW